MRKFIGFLLAAAALAAGPLPEKKPKLLLAVVVDQFRYDYLTRFRSAYTAGFARILKDGAVFTDAHHVHFPTVTAIGHSTFLSGATPSISGIVSNEWFDRESGVRVSSVSDQTVRLLGGNAPDRAGSSPNRLLASTVPDELKMAGKAAKVIGVSIKDRSAILPVGHMADGAYWFDDASGNFVSSTFYFQDLPAWVKEFNASRRADKYLNAEWTSAQGGASKPFRKMASKADQSFYSSLERTPFGNELIEAFSEQAIASEQLGRHDGTDVLAVSFSANDYVGHALGPDAPEVRDISIRTDQILGKLLDYIDQQIGPGNTLFVLTADHGVAPVPEVNRQRRMPGGRIPERQIFDAIESALSTRFGEGKWITASSGPTPYLNLDLMRERKLAFPDVENVAAEAVRALPHIFRVYTREQVLTGQVLEDYISRAIRNGFYSKRSGDLFIIPDAYWLTEQHGTSHGTPFNYDTHVPIIFMGPGIKAGLYYQTIAVNDIAPTLATMLEVEEPSGSVGRVLSEIFQ